MEKLIEFLNGFNAQTITSMICILWLFFNHYETRIDARFDKLENSMKEQSVRTDKLYEMFIDIVRKEK